ncbi:hypothetical protein E3P99_03106 [Wallemia hederae]|uniref:Uncharacterized protein n=1 Tax=Wallemia hederae TaxID=1540922 RepID=A0A4T0FGU7_9BASI|nr:hypothetical protein E3P99_03106 [Wallemia hederae]
MFKRAVKRQKREALEEKLGLADDFRGAVSDSDESEESGSDSEGSEGSGESGSERDSEEDSDGEDDEQGEGEEEAEEGDSVSQEDEESEEESDQEELEPVTVKIALKAPLFSEYPRKRCAICPGRLFTVDKFGDEHLKSKAHNRRVDKFTDFIKQNKVNNDDDVHAFIDAYNQQQGSTPKERSKKEERRVRQAKIAKEKRLQRKIHAQKLMPVPLDEVEKKHAEDETTQDTADTQEKAAKRAARRERKKANKAKYAEERRRVEAEVKEKRGKKEDKKDDKKDTKDKKKEKKDTATTEKPKKRKSKSKD